MDNQLENTGLNETIVENQVADVVIQKDLPYISVQECLILLNMMHILIQLM